MLIVMIMIIMTFITTFNVVMKNNSNCVIINNIIVTVIVSVCWVSLCGIPVDILFENNWKFQLYLNKEHHKPGVHLPILGTSTFTVPKCFEI